MNLTSEQQAIVDAEVPRGTALKTIAYAGAGKTSTLVSVAKRFSTERVLYLAFNKSVEKEAQQKFPENTLAKTGHALAYATCGAPYRSNLGNLYNRNIAQAYGLSVYECSLIVRSLENYLNSADDEVGPEHIVEDHMSRFPDNMYKETMVARLNQVWSDMQLQRNGLPMSHSGYLKKFCLTHPNLGYPIVLLDEAQDTNPVMLGLMLDQLRYGSRVYFVGDPYQQIYSWRGALDAMTKIEAPELRLTQSFRFGPAIANFGNQVLKQFFHEEFPLKGTNVVDGIGLVLKPYAVICRTNSGLLREAYSISKEGGSFDVLGVQSFDDMLSHINDCYYLYTKQTGMIRNKRIAYSKSFSDLKMYAEESMDIELLNRIQIMEDYGNEWPSIEAAVKKAHDPLGAEVIMTTCHKAKGLEWENVRLAGDFRELFYQVPSTDGEFDIRPKRPVMRADPKDESEINQEEVNLVYVAGTRARRKLQIGLDLQRLLQEPDPLPTGQQQ